MRKNNILSIFYPRYDLIFKHHLDVFYALKDSVTIWFPTWIVFLTLNYVICRFWRRIHHEFLCCYGKLECITLLSRRLQCSMNYQSTVVTKWRKSRESGFPKDRRKLSKTWCRNAYMDISFLFYPPSHHHPLRPVWEPTVVCANCRMAPSRKRVSFLQHLIFPSFSLLFHDVWGSVLPLCT